MNKVIITGRMTKDAEVKQTSNQKSYATFSVAVDRRFKDQNGNRGVDFINVVAWGSQAGFVAHYFPKGASIGIVGTLQVRTYEDAKGEKKYITEVIADEIDFVGSKQAEEKTEEAPAPAPVPEEKPQKNYPETIMDIMQPAPTSPEQVDFGSLPFEL